MRLQLILPQVKASEVAVPEVCPHRGCRGRHFRLRQRVRKPLRDTVYREVLVDRYQCLGCGRSFRVYPLGVSRDQISLRVKGLGVMLYLLGLSYGAASLALEALGVYMCKSRVYDAVQETAERVPGLERRAVFGGGHTSALGSDVTTVKCGGRWLPIGVTVDAVSGLVLTVDPLPGEDAETLKAWLEPIAKAVGAELLVSDDADGFKTVADELALGHQVCKSHVKRNTLAMTEQLKGRAAKDEDGSLAAIEVRGERAVADLERLEQLIQSRRPQDVGELEEMHLRYVRAAPPRQGESASLAYRLRLLFLDRWNLWARLTRYRSWRGSQGETIDGSNNACERGIGWWIKERYRTMRGYKRPRSALNVSRLLAWCGNYLERGGADLASLMA